MSEMIFEFSSASVRGAPWIYGCRSKATNEHKCHQCGFSWSEPVGGLELIPDSEHGTFWPDLLGCGDFPEGVAALFSALGGYEAVCAIQERREKAVPALARAIKERQPQDRLRIAGMLEDLERKGVSLDGELSHAIEAVHRAYIDSIVADGEEAVPMLVHVLKVGPGRRRKFAALALRNRTWTKHADMLRGYADLIARTLRESGLQ